MMMKILFLLLPLVLANVEANIQHYQPNWKDLDKRPLPEWYDKAKIGIFLHWGVFSVPSFGSEWFWNNWHNNVPKYVDFMKKNYAPGFTYQDFAHQFTAEFFDPAQWAKLFHDSGAKYVVLTSKHHEGFTLFPSERSFSWNSVEIGPKRDVVGELSKAVKQTGLKFGLYHSLYEWFNPIYLEDKRNLFFTREYPVTKAIPDLKQLVRNYEPAVIWSDGDWECFDTYWNSTGFLAWLYNESPVKDEVVVNDRWGIGCYGKHGDFYNYADRYNPGTLKTHKWENAFTLDSLSWGYRRDTKISEIFTMDQILNETVTSVSCGGNVLINIGPTKEGTISPIYQERLLQLGEWLSLNGESIYNSSPWYKQQDSHNKLAWYTCTKTLFNNVNPVAPPTPSDEVLAVYAIFLKWPANNVLELEDITQYIHSGQYTNVELLGYKDSLKWEIVNGIVHFTLPDKAAIKSEYAWTLKFTSPA